MTVKPRAIVVNNDHPSAAYGATRLARAFATSFEVEVLNPLPALGEAGDWLASHRPDALVLSGSERSVNADEPWMEEERRLIRKACDSGLPVLAICFGHQLLGQAFGMEVTKCGKHLGLFHVRVVKRDQVFDGLGDELLVPEWHSEAVSSPPRGFELLATSDYCAVQMIRKSGAMVYGMQFHPCYEADLLEEDDEWKALGLDDSFMHDGGTILRNVVHLFAEYVRGR